jgi:hypothetical protein
MAVRYPIISGNWSNALIWNGGTLPTSSDDVYANGFTVVADVSTTVLSIQSRSATGVLAGGSFTLVNGITLQATNGFYSGAISLLNFTLTVGQQCSIVGYIQSGNAANQRAINFNGNGTLNCVGDWEGISSGTSAEALFVQSGISGIINLNGSIIVNSTVVRPVVSINGNITFNITGNIDYKTTSGNSIAQDIIAINSSCSIYHTGSLLGGRLPAINTTQVIYYNHTGSVISRLNSLSLSNTAFTSTNSSSIHIMTGPFICNSYGYMPIMVMRMNYNPTMGSYFEFRDDSTNGALSPSPAAPATRLVSPDTVVDSPIPANVRDGVSYALNTLTGTLKVPAAGSVALGVPVDNITGTAVLTPAAVWDYATSSLTTSGSIGERLKNASTVDTTGDQLAALL